MAKGKVKIIEEVVEAKEKEVEKPKAPKVETKEVTAKCRIAWADAEGGYMLKGKTYKVSTKDYERIKDFVA